MDVNFQNMNEDYKNKHYPKGSVFQKLNTEHKRGAVMVLVMLGLFTAGLGAVTIWELSIILRSLKLGETDDINVAWTVLAITAGIFLLCVLAIVFFVKYSRKGIDDMIRGSAKQSGLSEADIREFERQAMQSDSYILKLNSGVGAALTGQKHGILTREYLWMGSTTGLIVKLEDILGVCLYLSSYYAGNKKLWNLNVSVLTRQNIESSAEATEKNAREFMKLLAQICPSIQVEEKILREGKEYDNWRNMLYSKV